MKKLTTVLALAATMFAVPAFASTPKEAPEMTHAGGCEAAAAEKKLYGAAQTSFLEKCRKTAPKSACETKASEKKLSGAARTSFLEKCHKTAPKSDCEIKAAEKKLAGAAETSFLKKCNADSAAAAASGAASASK